MPTSSNPSATSGLPGEAASPPRGSPAHGLPPTAPVAGSSASGRLAVVAAAVLWSSSGLFAKSPTFLAWPESDRGLILAFYRALFAGLCLLPFVRRPRWSWWLVPMVVLFALMNWTYLTAMARTTAANAIWLQATAPLWIFLGSWLTGRAPFDRRNLWPLVCGFSGISLILAFEVRGSNPSGIVFGILSGIFYASVASSLRHLRDQNGAFLIALNHLVAAVLIYPFMRHLPYRPEGSQWVVLAAFGSLQMALPYLIFAFGLRHVTSQEGTLLALLEPVLVPVWVVLAWGEKPAWWTMAGAALILIGLLARYVGSSPPKTEPG